LECFSVAKNWAKYNKKSFILDEQLMESMFQLLEHGP
jgi:hypothetical protein